MVEIWIEMVHTLLNSTIAFYLPTILKQVMLSYDTERPQIIFIISIGNNYHTIKYTLALFNSFKITF